MESHRDNLLGDVFRPIFPLLGMLNGQQLITLFDAVAGQRGNCLADCDLSAFDLPPGVVMPSLPDLQTLCEEVLHMAKSSPLMRKLPETVDGVDRANLLAALIFYTVEDPFPFYLLVSQPLNVSGVRSKLQLTCQLPFLKLLTVAIAAVTRDGEYWYSGVLYRGVKVEGSKILKAKYDDYIAAFAPGTKVTFAAPTSATTNSVVASSFTRGIQYVIQGERPDCGPGGVALKAGDLSVYAEDEVLLPAPLSFEVVACTKVDTTVVVVLQVALRRPSCNHTE